MTNFKDLLIWQKGMGIVKLTFQLAKALPSEENYTIRPQVIRSSISIPSNIAEGAGRNSQKEFKRFIDIALGSCYELETQIIIIKENNISSNYNYDEILDLINEEQKMISTFIKRLASNI